MTDLSDDHRNGPGSQATGHGDGYGPVGAVHHAALTGISREFLLEQVEALQPHEFVLVASPRLPLEPMEIAKTGEGQLVVRVPPRLTGEPIEVPRRAELVERQFVSKNPASASEPWERAVPESAQAVDDAIETLEAVFDVDVTDAIDIAHGSHALEVEMEQRVAEVRRRIEPVLEELLGSRPEPDSDGDYLCVIDGIRVFVGLRARPGMPIVIRVFAITNGGLVINPELALFLARLNYSLTFGRFVLDVDHQVVWFDDTLLGEHADDEELRFTVKMVAAMATQWDSQIKQLFGGITQADMDEATPQPSTTKPGYGGYL